MNQRLKEHVNENKNISGLSTSLNDLNLTSLTFTIENSVAKIGFGFYSNRSMTVLDKECLTDLDKVVTYLTLNHNFLKIEGAIFFSHKPGCFLAGVDISLISTLKSAGEATEGSKLGQSLYNKIEDLPFPTIAAVDGVCLGGGLELALSCKTIFVSDSPKTSLGLPEVQLGLLPGFGGTYRLPQKLSLPESLDLLLSGRQIKAPRAVKMKLADEIFPKENLVPMAMKWIKTPKFYKVKNKKIGMDTLSSFFQDNFLVRKIIFQKARDKVIKKSRGLYEAPLKILDLLEGHYGEGRSSYLHQEALYFGELCASLQSENLRHLFFLMESSKKIPASLSSYGDEGINLVPPKRAAVVGGGVMGGGIVALMAENNLTPILKDLNYESLEIGLKTSSAYFLGEVKKRKLSRDEYERKQRSITPMTTYQGFGNVDLVIEAVFEEIEIKKRLFTEIEQKISPNALLVSNTSSLSIEEMAKSLKYPERFAGLHFFNPVTKMPLVEIVTHSKSSKESIAKLYKLMLSMKKTPLIVKDSPGFLVNRILAVLIRESVYLLEEGVPFDEVETAILNFGLPMGPYRLLDEVGFDIALKVGKIFYEKLGDRFKPSKLVSKLEEFKIIGKKGGEGFYLYPNSSVNLNTNSESTKSSSKEKETGRSEQSKNSSSSSTSSSAASQGQDASSSDSNKLTINPKIEALLSSIPKKSMDERTIQMRLILPMINEAAYILEEGVVTKAAEVDLGMIFGTGFPPFRGGLLKYADYSGPHRILKAIQDFNGEVSAIRYTPAPLLSKIVKEKSLFYDWIYRDQNPLN